jgi:hypothetical protein
MKRAAGDDYEQRKSAFFDRLLDLPVEDDR